MTAGSFRARDPDALLHDPKEAAERVLRMLREGKVRSIEGQDVEVRGETICVHGDTPGAGRICARTADTTRTRRRENQRAARGAHEYAVIPSEAQRSRGIPRRYLKFLPRDVSTSLDMTEE
jgi:hypothetical protein